MDGNRANESNTTDSVYYEFLRQLSIGILIFEFSDRDDGRSLKIAEANPKAAHFIGVRTEALRGAPLDDIPQFKGTNLTERFLPVLQNGNSVDLGVVSLHSSEKQSVVYRARAFPLSANRVGLTLEETTPQTRSRRLSRRRRPSRGPSTRGLPICR